MVTIIVKMVTVFQNSKIPVTYVIISSTFDMKKCQNGLAKCCGPPHLGLFKKFKLLVKWVQKTLEFERKLTT